MRRAALLLAPVLTAGLLVAPAASATPVDCSAGYAVGGYPKSHLVPGGFTAVPTPGGIFPWESGGYDHGQRVGATNLVAAIDAHAASCPGTIRVFGHSYGAAIVDTATLTLDHRPYAHRVHVHVTGSPRHPGGIEETWSWVPGFRGPVRTPANLGTYRSDCNYGRDYICHAPHPILDVIGSMQGIAGYLSSGHSYS